jgi:cytochrome c556
MESMMMKSLRQPCGLFPIIAIFSVLCGFSYFCAVESSRAAALEEGFKPVSTLEALMEHVDTVFSEYESYAEKKLFKKIDKTSRVLAELINVASFFPQEKNQQEWMQLSKATLENFLKLAEAGSKKDAAGVTGLLKKVNDACDACHEKFRD